MASAAAAAVRKASQKYRVFFIFPRVSVGLGRAVGDALFGLIGFRCESRAAHARVTETNYRRCTFWSDWLSV